MAAVEGSQRSAARQRRLLAMWIQPKKNTLDPSPMGFSTSRSATRLRSVVVRSMANLHTGLKVCANTSP